MDSILGKENYKAHLEQINRELEEPLKSDNGIGGIVKQVLLKGDHRFRALFFVLSGRLCNYHNENLYYLSTIFEYIHAGSCLHEDVLDKAEFDGKHTLDDKLWGNQKVVLGGSFLYSMASNIAVDSSNFQFLKKITDTTAHITEGQMLELIHLGDWSTDIEQYMHIIRTKKASLLSSACACGAIISGCDGEIEKSLGEFGLKLGLALQLKVDLQKYRSAEGVTVKEVIEDLRKGKISLPIIYTLAKLEGAEREQLIDQYKNHHASERDYRELIHLFRSNGIFDRIASEIHSNFDDAVDCLSTFTDSSMKEDILGLTRYVIDI